MADDDDEVGYGKPPQHSRFKLGRSGNPRGRPKGAKSWCEIVERVGNRRHVVTIKGKPQSLTQREIVIEKLYQKAMQGDLKAAQALRVFEESKSTRVCDDQALRNGEYHVTIEFEEEQIREMEEAERVEAARLAAPRDF